MLEEVVIMVLELVVGKFDGVEVFVSKIMGIGVSICYGEVENVEFNSDGVLGIMVYYQNCKGSVFFIDFSLDVIVCIVQVVLDIVCYIFLDLFVGVVDKDLLVFDVLDLDLFYLVEVFLDDVIELVVCVE